MVKAISPRQPTQSSATDRLKALEKNFMGLQNMLGQVVQSVNTGLGRALQPLEQRLADLEEILAAVVEKLDPKEIDNVVNARRLTKKLEEIEKAKVNIQEALASGVLSPGEAITEKSLIVGFGANAEGVAVEPSWNSLLISQIAPEIRPSFIGAKAGDKVPTMDGESFTVQEVYEINEARAKAVAATSAQTEALADLPITGAGDETDAILGAELGGDMVMSSGQTGGITANNVTVN